MSSMVWSAFRRGSGWGLCLALACALAPNAVSAQSLLVDPFTDGTRSASGGLAADPARDDAVRCLTLAVAYEAGNQSRAGQEAVAEVVMNRLAHPSFPKTVCGVVWQGWRRGTGCQFTFVCDGALQRRVADRTILEARQVAQAVMRGQTPHRVEGALNYHAHYVQPSWAPALGRVAQIGAHIFYRPRPGGSPEGALAPAQVAVWDQPDHEIVARAYARYRAVDEGPTPAPLLPPAAAVSEPQVFAPWGLAIGK